MVASYGFVRILTPDDVATAYADGKVGLLLAAEGADFLEGKIERVQWAYERGVRHLQLVHYRVNELGDIMTADPVHKGLTDFGAAVVRECNRLGIIIDVAHASAATAAAAARLSKVPVVVSHGGITLDTSRPGGRMMTPEHAKPILDGGGLIGMWPFGPLFRNIRLWTGYIAEMAKQIGVDHVGIGTDMEGGIGDVFNDYVDYPKVVEALLATGLSVGDTAKIVGGNHVRIFNAVAAAAG